MKDDVGFNKAAIEYISRSLEMNATTTFLDNSDEEKDSEEVKRMNEKKSENWTCEPDDVLVNSEPEGRKRKEKETDDFGGDRSNKIRLKRKEKSISSRKKTTRKRRNITQQDAKSGVKREKREST